MKKIVKKGKKNIVRKVCMIQTALLGIMVPAYVTASNPLQDTKLYTGGMALLSDAINVLLAATATITAACILISLFKYRLAEEQEKPKHKKNAISAVVIGVISLLVEALVKVVFSYFV